MILHKSPWDIKNRKSATKRWKGPDIKKNLDFENVIYKKKCCR